MQLGILRYIIFSAKCVLYKKRSLYLFKLYFIIFFYFCLIYSNAQSVSINTSGAEPDASAILDVASTTSGFLIPRLTATQRQSIPNPAQGLIIYNTSSNYFNIYNTGSQAGWYELSSTNYLDNTTGAVTVSVGVAINSSGLASSSSAMLDVSSTTKGILIPRTDTALITPSDVTGLSIYETNNNVVRYFNSSRWVPLCGLYLNNTTGGGSLAGTPGVSINSTGVDPDISAMLDISSTSKGILIPRMTDAERVLLNPVTGILIYNTTSNLLNYWNGTGWYSLLSSAPAMPSTISGNDSVCQGQSGYAYSVSNVVGVTYTWTYSGTGCTIASGQGTNSITADFSSIATSGTLSCTPSNPCGIGTAQTFAITVLSGSGFTTEWATTAPGQTITLPLVSNNSSAFNCTVYWGDGDSSLITAFNDADRVHTYAATGTYTVEIVGQCEGWSFNNGGDKLKIKRIIYWGSTCSFNGFKYLTNGFLGCTNLTSLGTGKILASGAGCANFSDTFRGCTGLTSIPAGLFDNNIAVSTSGFNSTFHGCSGLTSIPAGLFDNNVNVSSSGFYRTFFGCSNLTSIPSGLFDNNTLVSTTGFGGTFYNCSGLTSIPAGLFDNNTLVSTSGFNDTFLNCSNLTSIPAGLFDNNTLVSTSGFNSTFQGCTGLTSIPSGLFDNNINVSSSGFYRTFFGCSSLTSIPSGLFDNNTLVSTAGFSGTFYNCSGLTSIPGGLFDNNTLVSTSGFQDTFLNCSNLTAIPTGLFDNNTLVSTSGFNSTFQGCADLTSIPAGLFDNNVNVSASGFYRTFFGCSSLTSIPSGLFDNNTLVSTSGFSGTFYNCSGLTSIPAGLFDNNTLVSTSGFSDTFLNCSNLTSIPSGLFDNNTLVSTSGFSGTFQGCTVLTSIPPNLFDNNTLVSTSGFNSTFRGCTSLLAIPAGLFRLNTAATDFTLTFYDCRMVQLNRNIFFADGEEGTRFLNKSVVFTSCFERGSFTGVQGEAPYLWNCNFGTGTATKTSCFAGAGNSTTSLTNYPDELMTIDVAPATDWSNGDIITGQTSTRTCKIAGSKITNTTYIVNSRGGLSYTLGEIIGVTGTPAKLADQGVANPTFATSGWK